MRSPISNWLLAVAFLSDNIAASIIHRQDLAIPAAGIEVPNIATPAVIAGGEVLGSDSPVTESLPPSVPVPEPNPPEVPCPMTPEGVCSTTPGPPWWGSMTCMEPVVLSASTDPKLRWNGIYAQAAFQAAVDNWVTYKADGGLLSFSEQINDFFHGRDYMKCHQTATPNGCDSFLQCDQVRKGPGGWLVINSLVALNNLLMTFYNALSKVDTGVANAMAQMQKDFAPIPKDNAQAIKIIADIIGLGFIVFAAPAFNMAIKYLPYMIKHPDVHGTVKDLSTGLTGAAITLRKDAIPIPEASAITGDLRDKVIAIIRSWRDTTAQLKENLFSGTPEAVDLIRNLISDGKLLANGYNPPTDPELQSVMEAALYTILIPVTMVFAPDHAPFIINSETSCEKPSDYGVNQNDFSRKLQAMSAVCYDGKWYYIASAAGAEQRCQQVGPSGQDCYPLEFSVPPGMDKLDGRWGGVTKRRLILAAVNTWRATGFKNGAEYANPSTSADSRAALMNLELMAPGVVTIPVCSLAEARVNWKSYKWNSKKSANYPCN